MDHIVKDDSYAAYQTEIHESGSFESGCKKWIECKDSKTESTSRIRSSSQDVAHENSKRKPEKSPDEKSVKKKSHIAGDGEVGEDLDSASDTDAFA